MYFSGEINLVIRPVEFGQVVMKILFQLLY